MKFKICKWLFVIVKLRGLPLCATKGKGTTGAPNGLKENVL